MEERLEIKPFTTMVVAGVYSDKIALSGLDPNPQEIKLAKQMIKENIECSIKYSIGEVNKDWEIGKAQYLKYHKGNKVFLIGTIEIRKPQQIRFGRIGR